MGLRDQILTADDLPRERIAVPEWGCDLWVRPLTLAERDQYLSYYAETSEKREPVHLSAMLVRLAVVDELGERVFTEADFGAITQKSATVVDRLALRIQDVSGLRSTAKADAEKNSGDIPSASSSSV